MKTRYLPLAALAALALMAGCGGGGKSGSAGDATAGPTSGPPRAREPLAKAVQGLLKGLRNGDCRSLAPSMLHSSVRGPGVDPAAPPTAAECTTIESVRAQVLDGFTPLRTKQLGPTAIVEGSGKRARRRERVVTVWALDGDGSWRTVVADVLARQVGTSPRPSIDFGRSAARFVRAAASGDCTGFFRALDPRSRLLRARLGGEPATCRDQRAAYRRRDSFLRDLAADRTARPRELGRTADLGIYGLQLRSGRYVALIFLADAGGLPPEPAGLHDIPGLLDYVTLRKRPA